MRNALKRLYSHLSSQQEKKVHISLDSLKQKFIFQFYIGNASHRCREGTKFEKAEPKTTQIGHVVSDKVFNSLELSFLAHKGG